MTAEDRAALAAYSGWGGLSIQAVAASSRPASPSPEERGLIHEYYTPTKVAARSPASSAAARRPADDDGVVLALEPSAGIGRFVQAASGDDFDALRWLVVEWSELSAGCSRRSGPRSPSSTARSSAGSASTAPSTPAASASCSRTRPTARAASITEDPDRAYREKSAYAYFLRRGLDLLAPNGLGVFLVPSGFLTGRAHRAPVAPREGAQAAPPREPPTACRPRSSPARCSSPTCCSSAPAAASSPRSTRRPLRPRRRLLHASSPTHILGTEVGKDAGDDDQTAKPRWGYQVVGTFERLPDLVERPICGACEIARDIIVFPGARTAEVRARAAARGGTAGLSEHAASAVALGFRVDRYLAAASAQTTDEHVQLWPELVEALTAWTTKHGNPWASTDLRKLVAGRAHRRRALPPGVHQVGPPHRRPRDEAHVDAALRGQVRRPRRARRVGLPDQHAPHGRRPRRRARRAVRRDAPSTRRPPSPGACPSCSTPAGASTATAGTSSSPSATTSPATCGRSTTAPSPSSRSASPRACCATARVGRGPARPHRRPGRKLDRGHPARRARRHRRRLARARAGCRSTSSRTGSPRR
jgi:hypothetical protein